MLRCAIFGSEGKMGKAILKELSSYQQKLNLVECFTRQSPPNETNTKNVDFIIDFSSPSASLKLASQLENTGILIVCGTTGFTKEEMIQLKSTKSKILYSANFSPSIKNIIQTLQQLAIFYKDYEVEILERHHSLKKDAPSGTAILMGQAIAKARSMPFENIKFASLRQGNLCGLHEVFFTSKEDQITIKHEAFNKNIFAIGAIEAGMDYFYKLKNTSHGFFNFIDI